MVKTNIRNHLVKLPIFCPDATRAVLRSCDSADIKQAGIEGLVVNTYHLLISPGLDDIKKFQGIGKFMNWDGLTISDSGGFQIFSLLHSKAGLGKITDDGAIFKLDGMVYKLTPESCIAAQFDIGTDIIICLDDCPIQDLNEVAMIKSVERTIAWARRCKSEYQKQIFKRKLLHTNRPLLFAVVQGGNCIKERKRCAEELTKIGFDGYGFGGWPIDSSGKLNKKILSLVAELTKQSKFRFALGIGDPQSCVQASAMGYNIFDCVLPSRDGRHGRLYVWKQNPMLADLNKKFYEFIRINQSKFSFDLSPISEFCNCYTCQNYSRAYLYHLNKIGDTLVYRLATIHNLMFYTQLFERLQYYYPFATAKGESL